MSQETQIQLCHQAGVRCRIVRRTPTETIQGFITAWSARAITILVAPQAGLRLDEQVVVNIDDCFAMFSGKPAFKAGLRSRVVSVLWPNAGDLVGLAVCSR